MRQVWKYVLEVTDEQLIEMPQGAQILSVAVQNGSPMLWALVNPVAPFEDRIVRTIGTGHPVEDVLGRFLGTYQLHGGALVFHVFESVAAGEGE